MADLIQLLPVQVRLCAAGNQLTLGAGRHWLLATPSSAFVADGPGPAHSAEPGGRSAGPASGSAGQRSVRVLGVAADNRT